MYGAGNGNGAQASKSGFNSREGTTAGVGNGVAGASGVRGMNIYDQAGRSGEQDDHHGDGRKRGFWAALCCRA